LFLILSKCDSRGLSENSECKIQNEVHVVELLWNIITVIDCGFLLFVEFLILSRCDSRGYGNSSRMKVKLK